MANVGVVSGAFICISPSSSSEAWTLSNSRHLAADLQYSCSKVDSPPACSSTFLFIFLSPPPRFLFGVFCKMTFKNQYHFISIPGSNVESPGLGRVPAASWRVERRVVRKGRLQRVDLCRNTPGSLKHNTMLSVHLTTDITRDRMIITMTTCKDVT